MKSAIIAVKKNRKWLMLAVMVLALPIIMAPGRCGVSAEGFFSDLPAPDMQGTWDVTYNNQIGIDIDLGGGGTYSDVVSATGGTITFSVNGQPVDLEIDCSLDWITCPSEVWTDTVDFDQPRFATRPHQVEMTLTEQTCSDPHLPDEQLGECSSNPDDNLPCDEEICDEQDVVTENVVRVASISNPDPPVPELGSHPDYTIGIALSGGIAVPTANCVLLAASYADADIDYSGSYDPEENTMDATALSDGLITIDLSGACFWGTYVDSQLAAALLGARIRLTTGFTASKQ